MKIFPNTLAVVLIGAAPLAVAQGDHRQTLQDATQSGITVVPQGYTTPTPPQPLAEQTFFSTASGSRSPNLETANAIVQALAADPQLKGAKITVTPEENVVLLTGVTRSLAQASRAIQIASQHAGEGKVSNGLAVEEVFIEPVSVTLSESQTS